MSTLAPPSPTSAESATVRRRHYSFRGTRLEPTVAHGGLGRILTWRVEGPDPSRATNFIDLTILPPGTSIGVHRHGPDDEELYIVVSGHGRMSLDDEEFDVERGDVVVNSPSGRHGLRNIGDKPIELVVVEVPLRAAKTPSC